MSSRRRDPRGRFTSREPESSEDVTRGSESIEDTDPSVDPRERPFSESNPGQYGSTDEHDGPSESEPTIRMALPIPAAKEAKPIKLVQFDIPNLTKQNVRTWKSDVEEFCETQGVWEVVQQTLDRQDKPEELRALLADPLWASQDATARYYIKKNIQPEDKTSVRDIKNSGAVWKYLMGRYERTTQYDVIIALRKVTQWKKDPKI